jgi:hypothetical protein
MSEKSASAKSSHTLPASSPKAGTSVNKGKVEGRG